LFKVLDKYFLKPKHLPKIATMTTKMTVTTKKFKHGVFLDHGSVHPEDLNFSSLDKNVELWTFYEWTAPGQTCVRVENAEVLITNKTIIDEQVLDSAPELKLICICATGTNNVDLEAARARGVRVTNVAGYAQASVTQHTMALMLALATNWPQYANAVKKGAWSQSPMFCLLDFPAFELKGKTLGIVGFGSLGQAVARSAKAFEMSVIVANAPWSKNTEPGRKNWEEFLAQSDIISLHCPLTERSKHLFDLKTLQAMKPGAMIINTARGGIIDENALFQVLQSGHLGGAALDVLAQEPPATDHPLIRANLPNLIITPHCAWAARECRQALMNEVAKNIDAFCLGKTRNSANGI
jgi:glycerate dehydrogenase